MPLIKALQRSQLREQRDKWKPTRLTGVKDSPKKAVSLTQFADIYYRERNDPKQRKSDREVSLHASQLTSCRRKQQFELLNAPQHRTNVPVFLLRIYENGHSSEARIVNAIRYGAEKKGHRFVPKVRVCAPEIALFGELDGLLYMSDGSVYVVDIKTINKEGFAALVGVSRDYVWQFHAYMYAMGVKQTICFYENKDTQFPREFVVRFKDSVWKEIRETVIDYILDATRAETLVDRDEDLCTEGKCPYYRLCYSDPAFDEVDHRTPSQKKRLQVAR